MASLQAMANDKLLLQWFQRASVAAVIPPIKAQSSALQVPDPTSQCRGASALPWPSTAVLAQPKSLSNSVQYLHQLVVGCTGKGMIQGVAQVLDLVACWLSLHPGLGFHQLVQTRVRCANSRQVC